MLVSSGAFAPSRKVGSACIFILLIGLHPTLSINIYLQLIQRRNGIRSSSLAWIGGDGAGIGDGDGNGDGDLVKVTQPWSGHYVSNDGNRISARSQSRDLII